MQTWAYLFLNTHKSIDSEPLSAASKQVVIFLQSGPMAIFWRTGVLLQQDMAVCGKTGREDNLPVTFPGEVQRPGQK